jgi:hypothetical protein
VYRTFKSRLKKLLLRGGLERKAGFPFVRKVNAYMPPRAPTRHLIAAHFEPVQLSILNEAEKPGGALHATWRRIPGGHKWLHYFETYEAVMSQFDGRPIRMLEIGVYRGGSIRMWREFLPAESVIVGIDIDPGCRIFEEPAGNLFIRIGDPSDPRFLAEIVREFGPFDLILDDGSHVCSHMIASFNHLFLAGLKSPGIYMAEDTHSNFWTEYRDQRYSFVDLAKDLVDIMHSHYADHHGEPSFRLNYPARVPTMTVPRLAAEIAEIQFRDSLVVISRKTRTAPPVAQHL